MRNLGRSSVGAVVACVVLMPQLVAAGNAFAATSSDVQQYRDCSDLDIGVSVSASSGTTYLNNEIAYHGTNCGDQAIASYISAGIWACDSSGANCSGIANPSYSGDVGSYDFFDSRLTMTGASGYYYKFCVTLRNNDLESYNLCTGLVHV